MGVFVTLLILVLLWIVDRVRDKYYKEETVESVLPSCDNCLTRPIEYEQITTEPINGQFDLNLELGPDKGQVSDEEKAKREKDITKLYVRPESARRGRKERSASPRSRQSKE